MNTKSFFLFTLAASAMILNLSGCKDDDKPSTIPTQPTTMSIENGAEISETKVSLSVSGSTVEDQECNISYDYYIGTSQDNLVKTSPQDINLTPYTQYFWYAKAKTETDESEPTEIRTFYCVPPFEIETDNGDGEWAAVLRFKGLPSHKGGKVTLTPDKKGYNYQKEIEIPEGQDFCSIKMGNANNPTNTAYTHWWDDEHGVYYEPIIYDFEAVVNVQVGDKTISISNNAKEIILDKQSCVRDYEFNVYRLVKIGNQIWTADNFVSNTFCCNGMLYSITDLKAKYWKDVIDEDGHGSHSEQYDLPKEVEGLIYNTIKLPSGAETKSYNIPFSVILDGDVPFLTDVVSSIRYITLLKKYAIPKGFHISTIDDWLELERYYGVTVDTKSEINKGGLTLYGYLDPKNNQSLFDYYWKSGICGIYEGESNNIRAKLASQYEWVDTAGVAISHIGAPLNIKPFGVDKKTVGKGAIYFADAGGEAPYTQGQGIGLYNYLDGIIRQGTENLGHACIRLVKDVE